MTSIDGFTPQYDANGNVTNDNFKTYTWDAEGHALSIGPGTAVNLTYDALGRAVEFGSGGAHTQVVYGPSGGKLALMSGQSLQKVFAPLPSGTAVYNSSGLAYYRHSDWLGSSRFASTAGRAMYSSTAYAPYGEPYAQAGTTDLSFTGQNSDTAGGSYDFLFREYATQGRWPSPDPLSGSIANPQSLNRYAYVLNSPTELVDPKGLCAADGQRFAGPCSPDRDNPVIYLGSDLFGCMADGAYLPCSIVSALVGSGAAVRCPNNACSGITTLSNRFVQFQCFEGEGCGYYGLIGQPGAAYYSAKQAGTAAVNYINGISIAQNLEYCGNGYSDANGIYSFTAPTSGSAAGCPFDPAAIPGGTLYGFYYHTHDAFDLNYDSEQFSPSGCRPNEPCVTLV